MFNRSLSWAYLCCLAVAICGWSQPQSSVAKRMPSQLADVRPISQIVDQDLRQLIKAATFGSIAPKDDTYWILLSRTAPVSVVPFQDRGNPARIIYLYYVPGTSRHFFLQIARNPDAKDRPEVRFWIGTAPSEILFTEEEVTLLDRPSQYTFRIEGLQSHALSITDLITCIAQTLGISVATANWSQLFGSLTCDASNTLALYETVLNCLGTFGIGASDVTGPTGCLLGTAQLITCGFLNCSTTTSGFTLSSAPTSRSITQGQSTTFVITATFTGGSSGPVSNFTVAHLPSGATYSFSPGSIQASGGTTTLSIAAATNAQVIDTALTVTAFGPNGTTASIPLELNINPATSNPAPEASFNDAKVSKVNPRGTCSDPPPSQSFAATDGNVYLYFNGLVTRNDHITSRLFYFRS
jgi:hypothetical protein